MKEVDGMKVRRMICAISMAFVMALGLASPASAASQGVEALAIEPRADVITTRYRFTSEGVLQYRRWNETGNYWVDPYWRNV